LMILQKMQGDAIPAFWPLLGRVDSESQSLETACGNDCGIETGPKGQVHTYPPHGAYFAVRFGLKG